MRIPHGAQMGDQLGNQWEAFAPPWWRLDRWVWWWTTSTLRGYVDVGTPPLRSRRIRVIESKLHLPAVPRPVIVPPNPPRQGPDTFQT